MTKAIVAWLREEYKAYLSCFRMVEGWVGGEDFFNYLERTAAEPPSPWMSGSVSHITGRAWRFYSETGMPDYIQVTRHDDDKIFWMRVPPLPKESEHEQDQD